MAARAVGAHIQEGWALTLPGEVPYRMLDAPAQALRTHLRTIHQRAEIRKAVARREDYNGLLDIDMGCVTADRQTLDAEKAKLLHKIMARAYGRPQ